MTKKALLAVSFGTTYENARKKAIDPLETALRNAFPDHKLARAFTSRMVIGKIMRRDCLLIDNPVQALEKLVDSAVTEVLVQPLLMIAGIEYEKTLSDLSGFQNRISKIMIGEPLLTSAADFERIADAYHRQFAEIRNDEALLLMGHGSQHEAHAAYSIMINTFKKRGIQNAYVATIEAAPTIEEVIFDLKQKGIRTVNLMPFMLVAGDHVQNDMAGNEPDSWLNILKNEGFSVNVDTTALGESAAIQKIFVEHAMSAHEIGRL